MSFENDRSGYDTMTAHRVFALTLHTQLGDMIAIASDTALLFLEFTDRPSLKAKIQRFEHKTNAVITEGKTWPLRSIQQELEAYFSGELNVFQTSMNPIGTPFQLQVWNALMQIPFGETRSYRDIAHAIGRPVAFRAVARANSTNPLALIIPCHRVIQHNGNLGGYAGGLERKSWLLRHETKGEKRSAT